MANTDDAPDQLGLIFADAAINLRRVWTVGSLVGEVRNHIEQHYADVWVEGEISNLRSAPSGHLPHASRGGGTERRASLTMQHRLDCFHRFVWR